MKMEFLVYHGIQSEKLSLELVIFGTPVIFGTLVIAWKL